MILHSDLDIQLMVSKIAHNYDSVHKDGDRPRTDREWIWFIRGVDHAVLYLTQQAHIEEADRNFMGMLGFNA